MLKQIQNFFGLFIEPGLKAGPTVAPHALQLATAALLLEMMRMDDKISAAERGTALAALRSEFNLSQTELDTLVALAEQEAKQATSYYQFTSLINKSCDPAQKAKIVEYLWQVAYADGHLDAHESHLLRKIADLLYIPQADYVVAKQRGRQTHLDQRPGQTFPDPAS